MNFESSSDSQLDIFDLTKKYNLTVQVEYRLSADAYRITVADGTGYKIHTMLDGLMLDSKPEFRKIAILHCMENYIKVRRL